MFRGCSFTAGFAAEQPSTSPVSPSPQVAQIPSHDCPPGTLLFHPVQRECSDWFLTEPQERHFPSKHSSQTLLNTPDIPPAGTHRWAQMNITFAPSYTPCAGHSPSQHNSVKEESLTFGPGGPGRPGGPGSPLAPTKAFSAIPFSPCLQRTSHVSRFRLCTSVISFAKILA